MFNLFGQSNIKFVCPHIRSVLNNLYINTVNRRQITLKQRQTDVTNRLGILEECFPYLLLVLRALGIPTRAISNFNSAHDTDGNCTYDRYYDENGEFLSHLSRDSTWLVENFLKILLKKSLKKKHLTYTVFCFT